MGNEGDGRFDCSVAQPGSSHVTLGPSGVKLEEALSHTTKPLGLTKLEIVKEEVAAQPPDQLAQPKAVSQPTATGVRATGNVTESESDESASSLKRGPAGGDGWRRRRRRREGLGGPGPADPQDVVDLTSD